MAFNKGWSAALECYDAGVLSENKVKSYCDNYPYVGGSLRFDGIEVHLSQKCSAVNAYSAIPIQLEDEVALRATLPDKTPSSSCKIDHFKIIPFKSALSA